MNKTEDTRNSAEVCDGLFVHLLKSTNGQIELTRLNENEAIVVLVWHLNGIVGNMGLGHCVEIDIPGDPMYIKTLNAINTINANACHRVVKEAISICRTSSGNSVDWEADAQKCQRVDELEVQFFDGEDELVEKLYLFILDNF